MDYAALEADPKWLEDAVLRILRKHAPQALTLEEEISIEECPGLPAPWRFWRIARASLVLAALVGAAALGASWRYPTQTAAFVSSAKAMAVRIGPPSSWLRALRAQIPTDPLATEPAPTPLAPAPTTTLPPIIPAPTISTSSASPPEATTPPSTALAPVVQSPTLPSTATSDVAPPRPKTEAKRTPHAVHRIAAAAVPVAETAEAPPSAPSAPPPPGSLADAIKRAGTGGRMPPPIGEHAIAPDPKPAIETALPDCPSASVVTSALLAVLPDARACMSEGDEPKQASVLFESSGAVSSVQVSGASASCIQKALSRARVAPFGQPTYRATVPVRPN